MPSIQIPQINEIDRKKYCKRNTENLPDHLCHYK